ncbi:DUF2793 domain-containing protein [Sphingobium sp. JS3065]|uniref:DUF2793 domain-containing protein n=1 Tax=Sphingobium sp. JS3065 TaxID=2970925 RepID=UPI002263CEED|nr:DUF2793 domain-containing protein [Sphingobium sp. JS3065]UZW55564.1 DUF2793 domain-containing protein [Sphingobium sp. JS3065]
MNLPRTGGSEWAEAQATPWNTVNPTMRGLDAFATRAIIEDRNLTAPPGACDDGACYLVATSPTGAWSGEAGMLAVAKGEDASNGWIFIDVAVEGVHLYVRDEDLTIYHDGAGWDVVPVASNVRAVSFQVVGSAPTLSELLLAWTPAAGETVLFADDFAGATYKKTSAGSSNPASTYTMDVKKNGASVGSIAISTSGTITFATSGTTVSIIGGTDILEVFGSATPDSGAVGYTFTLKGTF